MKNVDLVIKRLQRDISLSDFHLKIRLERGIKHLIQINCIDSLAWTATMNRYSIPIFTRLVYLKHNVQIPVNQYVEDVRDFIAEYMEIDKQGRSFPLVVADTTEGPDVEAETMSLLTNMFIERNKAIS